MLGNQLAVVHDADAIADSVQQAFAIETKLSETTFVQTPDDDAASYRNRIWTTTREMDFAGHPSLGTAVAIAAAEGDDSVSYVQQTPAGLQPIQVSRGGDVWRAEMVLAPVELGEQLEADAFLAALGLGAGDGHPELPAMIASCGNPVVLLPLAEASALSRVAGDYARMTAALAGRSDLIYAFVPGAEPRARAVFLDRGFAAEDPATGSAAGPLTGYLHEHAALDAVTIDQGVAMGRASVLRCSIDGGRVQLGGDVVVVSVGEVRLPAG